MVPTGFDKSLIYKLFVEAKRKQIATTGGVLIVVVSPLTSIIAEQLTLRDFDLSAVENFTLFTRRRTRFTTAVCLNINNNGCEIRRKQFIYNQ